MRTQKQLLLVLFPVGKNAFRHLNDKKTPTPERFLDFWLVFCSSFMSDARVFKPYFKKKTVSSAVTFLSHVLPQSVNQ